MRTDTLTFVNVCKRPPVAGSAHGKTPPQKCHPGHMPLVSSSISGIENRDAAAVIGLTAAAAMPGLQAPSKLNGRLVAALSTCLPVEFLMPAETRMPTAEEVNDPRQLSLSPRNDWDKFLTPAAIAAMEAAEAGVVVPNDMQLPAYPETMRVIPSALLRSALFGVVRRGGRRQINGETLTSWKGASIRYKGEQLDQYDLDVWLQVLHVVRAQSFDVARAHFTARGFLGALGRKYSGAAAKVLFESLERMVACAVTVTLNGRSFTGSLVEKFYRDGERYVVRLDPSLCRLFDAGHTRLSWDTRLALPMDLSRWLHGYVLSHQATLVAPHRIAVQRICALTGSSASTLRKFRQTLKQAMAALEATNVVWRWRITEGDALEFVRPSSVT